jgi:16S rRNA (uracil1498-N3)-methyltransferase
VNPRLRRSAAHVFVESLAMPVLADDDAHHLGRVLRIRATDEITVSDGRGAWAPARWTADGGIELVDAIVTEPVSQGAGVVSAVPKGDRPEWIVQKLTELGIDRIGFVPLTRSVVRWEPSRAAKQLDRLRRIAREAAMQSRRVWLPVVEMLTWAEVLDRPGVVLAEPDGGPLDASVETIVIGPEGGFTDEELAAVPRTVALSSLVLRVETAALVAAVLLQTRPERTRRADG